MNIAALLREHLEKLKGVDVDELTAAIESLMAVDENFANAILEHAWIFELARLNHAGRLVCNPIDFRHQTPGTIQ
jgi:hypothetical protein